MPPPCGRLGAVWTEAMAEVWVSRYRVASQPAELNKPGDAA